MSEPKTPTEYDGHYLALLTVLDDRVAAAATSRGIPACNGRDDDVPCDIGDLHSRTAMLAHMMAHLLDEPLNVRDERIALVFAEFVASLRAQLGRSPKVS